MPPFDVRMTTGLFWYGTVVAVMIDAGLILLVRRLVTPERFRQMKWPLTLAAGLFFFALWTTVLGWGWDWFYSYIFPPWGRRYLPLFFGVGYAVWGVGMWWLAQKMRGRSAVWWCLLGGLEGLLSHIWAIWGLGAASNPPVIRGASPWAVLIFAIFEKMCYWSVILLVTTGSCVLWEHVCHKRHPINTRLGKEFQ